MEHPMHSLVFLRASQVGERLGPGHARVRSRVVQHIPVHVYATAMFDSGGANPMFFRPLRGVRRFLRMRIAHS